MSFIQAPQQPGDAFEARMRTLAQAKDPVKQPLDGLEQGLVKTPCMAI
jgi:hypothetical protein